MDLGVLIEVCKGKHVAIIAEFILSAFLYQEYG
jgi:hypothetical protein